MFGIEVTRENRDNKFQDYLDYIDRSRRTSGETRYEVHQKALTKETGKSYGLSDKELKEIGEQIKKEG